MEHRSGQRVEVGYTPPPTRPSSVAALAEFLSGDFLRESTAIAEQAHRAVTDPDPSTLYQLGGHALNFRQTLGHWEAQARSLYKNKLATQLDLTRDEHADSKRTGKEIEAAAEQPILALREALERIQLERDQMTEYARWAREMVKVLIGEQISGEATGDQDGYSYTIPAMPELASVDR